MEARHIIGFVLGGLAFVIVQPILSSLVVIALIGLLILLIVSILLPGGWLLFLGFRTFTGLFRGLIAPVAVAMLASLAVTGVSLAYGSEAGMILAFLIGGVTGLLIVSRLSSKPGAVSAKPQLFASQRAAARAQPVSVSAVGQHLVTKPSAGDVPVVSAGGWLGRRHGCISSEMVRNGVMVLGEASTVVVRTVVKGVLEAGYRVVIIGSPYMAAPHSGTKLVSLGKTSVNILRASHGDRFQLRRWAENIAVPLVVSTGLDTAEAGMVIRFVEKFGGARITPDDVDKLVAEYGPTSSARLKDALGMLTTFFGEGYPEPEKLFSGSWRQLVIDIRSLSQASQLFISMYLLYEAPRLFPGCVMVFDSAELGIPEQQILPYDARHVWLRTLKAVERLREAGFIMSSSTGLLAPELLDLADTYIITRGPAHARRSISERVGVDINVAAIGVGRAVVFTKAGPDAKPHLFEGEIIRTPVCDIKALEAEAEREATLLREEMMHAFRDTLLYAEFADMAEACYRVLRAVRRTQSPTPDRVVSEAGEDAKKALNMLLEKQYLLTDPSGVLGLTSLGEQALRDWEAKTRRDGEKHAPPTPIKVEQPQQEKSMPLQAGLKAFDDDREKANIHDYAEVERLVSRARIYLARGDSISAVGAAYKAAVAALKRFTGVEKGHLPELAQKAAEKGVLNVSEEEARRLFAANIESKRLSKKVSEGETVSEEDRRRMADAAELLISLAERVVVFSENLSQEERPVEVDEDG